MRLDRFGRPFIDGTERSPNDMVCLKCRATPYKQGNPYGVHVFEFQRADQPHNVCAYVLCDTCSIAMWEFLSPELLDMPGYTALKDQHMAAIPEFIEHWNTKAGDDEYRTYGNGS